jgi:hypothetical protein
MEEDGMDALNAQLPEGARIRHFGTDVYNVTTDGVRPLTDADLTALRAALAAAGLAEVRSWLATEGASWLTDGIPSVSIRVTTAESGIQKEGTWQ